MEKEKWKDGILQSWEGARRAEPGPDVYAKIRQKINGKMEPVQRTYLALAAACFAALLCANIWLLRTNLPETTNVARSYGIDAANFNIYP